MITFRHGRDFVWLLIVGWNVVPFVPVWPGYSGGGDSWIEWFAPFLFLNALFWAAVLALWLTGSGRSRLRRVVIAEVPGVVQAVFFLGGGWLGALVAVILRAVDALLLYWVDSRTASRKPVGVTERC